MAKTKRRPRAARAQEYWTVRRACDYLKLDRATLFRWIRGGQLRRYKAGARRTLLLRSDIENLIRAE